MKAIKIFVISLVLCGQLVGAQVNQNSSLYRQRMEPVVRVFEFRDAAKGLNPFLKAVFAKTTDPAFDSFVFLTLDNRHCSSETVVTTVDTPPPEGVQAALPVGFISRGVAYLVKVTVYYTPLGTVLMYHGVEGYYGNKPEMARFVNSLIDQHRESGSKGMVFNADSANSSRNEKLEPLIKGHRVAVELCDDEATWLYMKAIQAKLGAENYIMWVKEEIFAGICGSANRIIQSQPLPNHITVYSKIVKNENFKACGHKPTHEFWLAGNPLLLTEPHLLFASLCM
ncbi:MAG TPA: hypothetical protein VLH61_09970 [Bacteroidales bacterium]|nr:hypothetical protein [Bacteroidales bacterium]